MLAIGVVVSAIVASAPAARTPPAGTAMFVVQHDPRMCPTPLCGGFWVAIANGVRTRCGDGRRATRCYVASAIDRSGRRVSDIPEGALARAAIERGSALWDRRLDRLRIWASYTPSRTEPVAGGVYRVTDTGIRCVRAPCFSLRVTQVNGRTRTVVSSIDLDASGGTVAQTERARLTMTTKDGLYAQGVFAATPDGGRAFRALRIYLRAPLLRV